ncbi:MAG: alpha/beta hydrolase [Actinomycetota bacterium]|nr:alpha/beta hydrolase [Actinomycetota bacterium]
MEIKDFDAHRRTANTPGGSLSYVEIGQGTRTALFVHGVGTGAYLWRNVIEELGQDHRCLALDLPLHGRSPARTGQSCSVSALAGVVESLCETLGLDGIDLVANDTGGAIAQVFAAGNPKRLRTLTLTNCDTQDNMPPEAFKPTMELAASGQLAVIAPQLLVNPALMRGSAIGQGFERPEEVNEELYRAFLEPVLGTPEAAREFERLLVSLDAADLREIEPELKNLNVPTRIVWGTDDPFFGLAEAYWLRDTIPGVTKVVELLGAKLFFPEERAAELATNLAAHWSTYQ